MKWCEELCASQQAQVVYFALVLVILLVALIGAMRSVSELFGENQSYVYTSGADQRFFGERSDPNIEPPERNWSKEESENLTAYPGEPDLWAVGHDLAAFKASVTGQTLGLDVGRSGMGMKNMTTEHMKDDMYEDLLQKQALLGA